MEIWDLYTKDRIKTGRKMIEGEKTPAGYFRLFIHVSIFNSEGELLIQQRRETKKRWPDLWDITVGGRAISGDTSQTAAQRETFEELGYKIFLEDRNPSFIINFEEGFDDFYILHADVDIKNLILQKEEVKDVRWAKKEEIFEMIDSGIFIPYKKSFIDFLFSYNEEDEIYDR